MIVFTEEIMNPLFDLLDKTKGVTQMEEHHPEGDVFQHSLQCLKWAMRESDDTDLILAAMLHDVGKISQSKGHEKDGVEMIVDLVSTKTLWLVEYHMRFWYWILGEMRKLKKCQYIANHPWLPELCQLARWDKLARNPRVNLSYDRQEITDELNRKGMKRFERRNK